MPQQEIEVILARQLADYLAMPIFIIDPQGTMIYYNEPAEEILGCRFNETGAMALDKWTTAFAPMDENGAPLAVAGHPMPSSPSTWSNSVRSSWSPNPPVSSW